MAARPRVWRSREAPAENRRASSTSPLSVVSGGVGLQHPLAGGGDQEPPLHALFDNGRRRSIELGADEQAQPADLVDGADPLEPRPQLVSAPAHAG